MFHKNFAPAFVSTHTHSLCVCYLSTWHGPLHYAVCIYASNTILMDKFFVCSFVRLFACYCCYFILFYFTFFVTLPSFFSFSFRITLHFPHILLLSLCRSISSDFAPQKVVKLNSGCVYCQSFMYMYM